VADAQGGGNFVNRDHRWIAVTAFEAAYVLLAKSRDFRKPLLSQAPFFSYPPDVLADQSAHIHAPQVSGLCTISLSTIVCR
jgi:hypothetical protein